MRKSFAIATCALALSMAPIAGGMDQAKALDLGDVAKGVIGGIIAGAVIGTIVRAGQNHCHEGLGCHSHAAARAYHYHQYVSGPILYQQAAAPAPAGYPPAHYQWCSKYRTYHAGSNTYIRVAGGPRVQCVSPYIR